VVGLIAAIILQLMQNVGAEKMDSFSFQPPFTEIDSSGGRMVSRSWRASGSTNVNKNFVRLTPDLQSKTGALWSRESLDVPSFSSIMNFRISGKGKDFYGDGIALWIVQQGYYLEGDLHGFQEDFVGVGIIFDTFQNSDDHMDVTVLINNGEKDVATMTKEVKGCNLHVRYHGERADFKVTDGTAAKVIVNGRNLTLMVDAKNTGDWKPCVDLTDMDLPEDWASESYLGITAATGQLSDNHDILSLVTYVDQEVMEKEELIRNSKTVYEVSPKNTTPEDRMIRLETAMNKILNKIEFMDHHYEHHFATNSDHIDHVKAKLDNRENSAESRIEELESLIHKKVSSSMTDKLSDLESELKSKMDEKVYMYTFLYIYIYTYMYLSTYIYTCIHTYIYINKYKSICLYYIHMYIYTHIGSYTR
jgi:mannose-binding lectin 2